MGTKGNRFADRETQLKGAFMYISGFTNNVGGIFDSFAKFIGGASNTVNKVATGVVQGKQTYDAAKAAWKGVPYVYPTLPQGTFPPYAPVPQPSAPQSSVPQITSNRALTRDEIAKLQSTLNSLGFNTGVVDGIYGPNTRAGIIAFQSARGLKADGLASAAVFNEVMRVAAPAASGGNVPTWDNQFPGYSAPQPQPQPQPPEPKPAASQEFDLASLSQFALPLAAVGALILLTGNRR